MVWKQRPSSPFLSESTLCHTLWKALARMPIAVFCCYILHSFSGRFGKADHGATYSSNSNWYLLRKNDLYPGLTELTWKHQLLSAQGRDLSSPLTSGRQKFEVNWELPRPPAFLWNGPEEVHGKGTGVMQVSYGEKLSHPRGLKATWVLLGLDSLKINNMAISDIILYNASTWDVEAGGLSSWIQNRYTGRLSPILTLIKL